MCIVHVASNCKLYIKVLDGQQINLQIYHKIFNLVFFFQKLSFKENINIF